VPCPRFFNISHKLTIQNAQLCVHFTVRNVVLVTVFMLISLLGCGQPPDSTSIKRSTLFGLPLVFYTPETTWGFGAAGFYSWRFRKEANDSRPSQVQLGGAYTLEDQILAYLPFQLWWDEERYSLFGELGWYRYNYFFFGLGNGVDNDFEELYGVNYPRLRISFMRRFAPHFYLGIRAIADDFQITQLDPEGMLIQGTIPGSRGGLNAGAGFMANFDSRDNIFESHTGWYAELQIDRHGTYLGSDFAYTRLAIDVRRFFRLSANDHLAAQYYTESISGEAPFISQALLGGTKRMRGFYEGRYRDKHAALVQLEYRRHLIGRLKAVLFAATGAVANEYTALSTGNLRATYGVGLRVALNKADRINVRFDVGIGNAQPAFYLTVGEAF
jgi:outer membrane protein assembly factor BamA